MSIYSDHILAPALAASAVLKMDPGRVLALQRCMTPGRIDHAFYLTDQVVTEVWRLSGRPGYNPLDHTARDRTVEFRETRNASGRPGPSGR